MKLRTILNIDFVGPQGSLFRKVFFWLHLGSGVIAGIIIAIMSITGVALAFEPQLIAWADREARTVQVPSPVAPRISIDEMLARVAEARPGTKPMLILEYSDPASGVLVKTGNSSGVYVNPYTGQVGEVGGKGMRLFLHEMEDWHRWLGAHGDNRAVARAVTGVSNTAFLFLAISGLYLWWPRKWGWRALRPTVWFKLGLRGKARDFNWHNVISLWSLPVIIVLTASGMVISYKWASDLLFTLTGNEPPKIQGPFSPTVVKVPTPAEGAQPLGYEPLFAEARRQAPPWKTIMLRIGAGAPATPPSGSPAGAEAPPGPQPVTFLIKEQGTWPLFASAQVSVDPFTGQALLRETYADYNSGRQLRTWLRFLHTGEALGWMGQLIAGIASLGAAVLVWTGFALSWRRFFTRRRASVSAPEPSTASVRPETTA